MHRTDSGFYVIDVLPLHHASKRPFHLEKRMRSKKSSPLYSSNLPLSPAEAHLKREAILEARRLKLARQFLHVKDVLDKQHQRALRDSSAKRSQIQTTLRMAEKNRNLILQKLVEQAAQEVARCKEVARMQQLKNQEETDRRRKDMERRQKATAARRARLLSASKTKTTGSNANVPMSREEAAVFIQGIWRYNRLMPCVKAFRKFGINIHAVESISFGDIVALLQKPAVIQATSKLLARIRKVSSLTSGSKKYKNFARVFLSVYMITAHTGEILVDMGPHENELLSSAKSMLANFERWIDEVSVTTPGRIHYSSLVKFLYDWDAYYNAFNTWKTKDSEKLTSNLIAHYLDYEKLWNTVKNQANAETEWRPNIVFQQEEIRRKVRNLGGDAAMARLENALRQLRKKIPKDNDESGFGNDTVKRSVSQESGDWSDKDDVLQSPSASPSLQGTGSSTISSSPVSNNIHEANNNLQTIIQSFGGYGAGLSNEKLAHEIIIDPDFELKPQKRTELEERVRAMTTKALLDSAREDFEQGRYDKWIPSLMKDIKQTLQEIVPRSSLYNTIEEVLDIDLITQQTKVGVYDIRNSITFIIDLMLQICAPVRDEQIKSLKDMTDLAEIFQHIFEFLDMMKLDLLNYQVKLIRPYLKEQAVEYERGKFESAFVAGKLSLERTKAWLYPTVDALLRTAAERNPERVNLPQHRHNHGIKFDQVFDDAFISLIFQPTQIDRNNCPETFLLDVERLWNFQNESQMVTIVAVLIMLTKNIATASQQPNVADLETLKDRLFILLSDGDMTIDNLSAEVSNHFPKMTPETQSLINSMVSKTLSQNDKVYSLLSRRVQTIVKTHLQSGQFPKPELLAQYGVASVAKELEALSKKIRILGRYNREVYAKWYDETIRERLRSQAGGN
ncbi:7974_t:CDS:2 [Paraglomus brasilianum]|uniref:7974_t:CDS:1 n=1 Tax=Paraglomus brasilianum TaxID=144538 RepID=A0A9N9CL94_9GLOM|nr:7974_t:CDS:2 [Paraglomus brasilianum]